MKYFKALLACAAGVFTCVAALFVSTVELGHGAWMGEWVGRIDTLWGRLDCWGGGRGRARRQAERGGGEGARAAQRGVGAMARESPSGARGRAECAAVSRGGARRRTAARPGCAAQCAAGRPRPPAMPEAPEAGVGARAAAPRGQPQRIGSQGRDESAPHAPCAPCKLTCDAVRRRAPPCVAALAAVR